MVLPTNSRQEFQLALQLPAGVLKNTAPGTWSYSLRILKQPGLALLPVTVTVKIPAGAAATGPAGWVQQSSQSWSWQGSLTGPQDLSLTFCCTP
jgi:hypothetical protein